MTVRHFTRERHDQALCGVPIQPPQDLGRNLITNVNCPACIQASELCPRCGQPDNCGDCDHTTA